jgi:hypothetical protein
MYCVIRWVETQFNEIKVKKIKPSFDLKKLPKSGSQLGSLLDKDPNWVQFFNLATDYKEVDEELRAIQD